MSKILKFVLTELKVQEKDIMYEFEKCTYTIANDKGEEEIIESTIAKALSARFMHTCFALLNT